MKKLMLLCLLWLAAFAQADVAENWWQGGYPEPFDQQQLEKKQSTVTVSGNRFVDEAGNVFLFKGVNIADPDKLAREGHWNKALFEEVKRWGANTIRLPIHPAAWDQRGPGQYFAWIDQAVVWANALDMYLIIDWHSIGNLHSGLFQHPMYVTDFQKTLDFWQKTAFRYKGVATVAVYELFNEPTHSYVGNGDYTLGAVTWQQWKTQVEAMIDLVRAYDKEVIPLVTGFNWAYDLTPVRSQPFERDNIAYAAHPYPQKARPENPTRAEFFRLWDEHWGFVADKAPIIATEIGWANENEHGAHVPTINNDHTYGPNIVAYLDQRGISWTAWCFDPSWSPTMIKNWDFEPTEQGAFFKKVLQGRYNTESAN
ncbi:MAG TPA: cellulase family glycosylhydrolase [Marinagarivorans sp.]